MCYTNVGREYGPNLTETHTPKRALKPFSDVYFDSWPSIMTYWLNNIGEVPVAHSPIYTGLALDTLYFQQIRISNLFAQPFSMLSLIDTTRSNASPNALADLLQKYGVSRILECDSTSTPEIPSGEEDIIFVNCDHEFSTAAIRQVTFRTARLPREFVIWDSSRQQRLF